MWVPAAQSSEEVIEASITAGSEPCLIYNTAPAAVPDFEAMGGLVPLNDFPGAVSYIYARTGALAGMYKSPDGEFYQMPWKSNPVVIFYNKTEFAKAGISTTDPPLATYSEFLATAKKLVSSGAAKLAIDPSPSSEFYQSWYDFYPLYAAESGGKLLVEKGKATFDSLPARRWPRSGRNCTKRNWPATRPTPATPSPTAPRRWPSSGRGPSPTTRAARGRPGQLRRGAPADLAGQHFLHGPDVQRLQEHRHVRLVQEPRDRMGLLEVHHQPGARTANCCR